MDDILTTYNAEKYKVTKPSDIITRYLAAFTFCVYNIDIDIVNKPVGTDMVATGDTYGCH